MAPSPNSLTMYEHDHSGQHGSISSCGGDDALSPSLDFDLKPQFEYNDDSLFKLDLASLKSSFDPMSDPEHGIFKMEDVFQEEKSRDIIQGPTLAELNFENSVTMPGFLENDVEPGFGTAPPLMTQPYVVPQQDQQALHLQQPERKQWNTTSLLTAFLTRPALRSFSSQTSTGKPTCTVTSPTSVDTQVIKTENSDPNAFEVTGSFSLVPNTTANRLPERKLPKSNQGQVLNNNMVESKSALADLLTQSMTSMAVSEMATPVPVKSEDAVGHQQACQHSGRTLTELTPVKRGVKRNVATDDVSNTSVDRKWEEIKQFIHDDEAPTFPTTSAEPLVKKIKTEPQGKRKPAGYTYVSIVSRSINSTHESIKALLPDH